MAANQAIILKEEPFPRTTRQSERSKLGIERDNNLTTIKYGMDAGIEKALSLYGKDDLRLSKIYWPRAFRSLLTTILESLLKKPELWNELHTPSFHVNHEQLQRLISELNCPASSPSIKVVQRQWIIHLLKEVSFNRRKFGLSAYLPSFCGESTDWPTDLEDKDDLFYSMANVSLRDDVKRWIWKVLDEIIPPQRYCNMHFLGGIRSSKKSLPIVIEVTEDYVERVIDRIATLSYHLSTSHCENLLPVDLIEVIGVPVRGVVINQEELCTLGSHVLELS